MISFSVQAGKLDHLVLSSLPADIPGCYRCQDGTPGIYQLTCNNKHIYCEGCLDPYTKNRDGCVLMDNTVTLASDRSFPVFCPACNPQRIGQASRACLLESLKTVAVLCQNCGQQGELNDHWDCVKKKPAARARKTQRLSANLPDVVHSSVNLFDQAREPEDLSENLLNILSPREKPLTETGFLVQKREYHFDWVIPGSGSRNNFSCYGRVNKYSYSLDFIDAGNVSKISVQFNSDSNENPECLRIVAAMKTQSGQLPVNITFNSFSPIASSQESSSFTPSKSWFDMAKQLFFSPSPNITIAFFIYPVHDTLKIEDDNKSAEWSIPKRSELIQQSCRSRKPVLSKKFSLVVNPDSQTLSAPVSLEMHLVYGLVCRDNPRYEDVEIGIAISQKRELVNKLLSQNVLKIYAQNSQGQSEMVHECRSSDFAKAGQSYFLSTRKLDDQYAHHHLPDKPMTFTVQVERDDRSHDVDKVPKNAGHGLRKKMMRSMKL